jgi:hypothetical protein
MLEPADPFQLLPPEKLIAVTQAVNADFVFSVPSIIEVKFFLCKGSLSELSVRRWQHIRSMSSGSLLGLEL